MKLVISQKIRDKLSNKVPPVSEDEFHQCFTNMTGKFLLDRREDHQSDPQTRWFVAETDYGRKLKVAFIPMPDGSVVIKSSYTANRDEIRIYNKYGNR